MKERELTDEECLNLLHEDAEGLKESIDDLDRQIARAISSHTDGTSLRRDVLSDVHELHGIKQELVFKLGRVSVHIEQVLARMPERNEQQQRQPPENGREEDAPVLYENHLDWLDAIYQRTSAPPDEGEWQEPERDHR